jgi:integrase
LRGDDSYLFSPAESERHRRAEAHENRVTPLSCGNTPGSKPRRKRKHPIGDHYTVASYRRCITRACEENNLPHWFPGQLRHTFATKSRKEYGMEVTSILLGHADIDTTKVYAERDRDSVLEALTSKPKAKPRKRSSAS